MVEMTVRYDGDLRCSAIHKPSGAQLFTDAPTDNMGKGQNFSPTDLLATSLASCILTIMGIVAQRNNIDLGGATITVGKDMSQSPPRKIARLAVAINIPASLDEQQRQRLINAAETCPVKKSLNPDILIETTWHWG